MAKRGRRKSDKADPEDVRAPHNLDAEKSVLGSMMLNADAVAYCVEQLEPEDFWRAAHRHIFAAMLSLAALKRDVDMVTIRQVLQERGLEDAVDGPAYLASLVDGVPRSTNYESYAAILGELRLRRELLDVSQRLAAEVVTFDCDGRALAADVEGWLANAVKVRGDRELQAQDDIMVSFMAKLEARIKMKGTLSGVASGFTDIDACTRGFHPEDFTVIAARPSMGKSAMMLNMAEAAAVTHQVGVFSCEMSKEQLEYRMVSGRSNVPLVKILNGWLSDDDYIKISNALCRLKDISLYIDDTPGLTVASIRSKCRALKASKGLDIVFVDYIQLLRPRIERNDNKQADVAEISSDLKRLARQLKIPVVALSQLSRKVEERQNKRPILSDLRESGALEQDADIVAFLYRPEVYTNKPEDVGVAEYIVGKHRQGELATVNLTWRKEVVKFSDFAHTPS